MPKKPPKPFDEEEEFDAPLDEYVDHEVQESDTKKVLNALKTFPVREAIFVLNDAVLLLLKSAPADWNGCKVKKVLENL